MDKTLVARVRKLGNRICYLGEYNFADLKGYSYEEVEKISEKIKVELNFALPEIPNNAQVKFQNLESIEEADLKRWEQKVDEITREVQGDEIYQQALRAYNVNDQEAIGKLMTSIFNFYGKLKKSRILYHGVTPRKVTIGDSFIDFEDEKPPVGEYITPNEYINLMLKIQSEGLLPSVGEHQNIDENLRPVFTVPNYEDTHGILFFEFDPMENGYAVFIGVDDEHLIYTPRLKIPMGLCLKSAWYVETDRIEGAINPHDKRSEVMDYRNNLESRLRERGVPFTLVEPK